jgi:Tol biopolymer transport system component
LRRLLPVVTILVGLGAAAPASAVVLGANGKVIYTLQSPGNYDIWATQADGNGNVPLVTVAGNDQGGSWSPDGTKVVFRSDRTGGGDI